MSYSPETVDKRCFVCFVCSSVMLASRDEMIDRIKTAGCAKKVGLVLCEERKVFQFCVVPQYSSYNNT
eukprot:scaffold7861_cov126-Cylindrotheca_fusiformis.AAC.1